MATAHTTSLCSRVQRVRMERGRPGATAASCAIGTGCTPPSLLIRNEYGLWWREGEGRGLQKEGGGGGREGEKKRSVQREKKVEGDRCGG